MIVPLVFNWDWMTAPPAPPVAPFPPEGPALSALDPEAAVQRGAVLVNVGGQRAIGGI